MVEYGYEFSKILYAKLKKKIYAGVFVKVSDDNKLEITIARTNEGLVFKMGIDNFSDRILHGYSTDYAVYEILAKYKRYILNRYFVVESDTN